MRCQECCRVGLSVQLAPSSQIVALEAMWCDAEGRQTAGEIVPLEGSIQSRAWSRLLFEAEGGLFEVWGCNKLKDESYLSFRVESWDSSKRKYCICLAFANRTTINLLLVLCINQFGDVSKGWQKSWCIVIASKIYKTPKYKKNGLEIGERRRLSIWDWKHLHF